MKSLLLSLFVIPLFCFGQQPIISQSSLQDIAFIKRNIPLILKNERAIVDELPLIQISGQEYVSFIGKLRDNADFNSIPDGVIIGKGKNKIRSVRVQLDKLNQISAITQLEYLELAKKIKPSLNKVVFDTRVDSVHAGLGLPQSFTGKDVLIGINDWGFDYTSPMFYDTLLQETRIVAVWDQFRHAGSAPADYNYGVEYLTKPEIIAAQGDTSNQLSYGTHATHVAGIAGGSGAGIGIKGMAFESNYLFTTILVDEAAALDSWAWMQQKADNEGKRLVVNMSWGLYHFGTNDGTSLLSQAIDDYADMGVLFVSSAGNNGNVNFHFERTFNNDSIKSRVNFYDYALHDSLWGQSIHGWGEIGKNFEVKIEAKTTSGVALVETPYFSTTMNAYNEGYIIANTSDTIWYTISAQELDILKMENQLFD